MRDTDHNQGLQRVLLSFDGPTLQGTPVVEDGSWDGDGGIFKTVTLKFRQERKDAGSERTSTSLHE